MSLKKANADLFVAVQGDNSDAVRSALTAGAEINCRDHLDRTPLHWAASVEIARLLLRASADTSAKDKFGNTALNYANQEKSKDLIALLEDDHKKQRPHASRITKKREQGGNEVGGNP